MPELLGEHLARDASGGGCTIPTSSLAPVRLPDAELPDLDRLALVVVDVQRAFGDAAYWGMRDNPACEANVAALIEAWRARGRRVVFVRHDSVEPDSPLRRSERGFGTVTGWRSYG